MQKTVCSGHTFWFVQASSAGYREALQSRIYTFLIHKANAYWLAHKMDSIYLANWKHHHRGHKKSVLADTSQVGKSQLLRLPEVAPWCA